jgi:hypothetical protein
MIHERIPFSIEETRLNQDHTSQQETPSSSAYVWKPQILSAHKEPFLGTDATGVRQEKEGSATLQELDVREVFDCITISAT